MVEGWILDIYPGEEGQMVIWLKINDGQSIRLTDRWFNSIYVACDDGSDLEYLQQRKALQPFLHDANFVEKRERVTDCDRKSVLQLMLKRANEAEKVAEIIERMATFGHYRLYNVDLLAAQTYMFEKDLFTLAYVRAEKSGEQVIWKLLDSVESEDYELPQLRIIGVGVKVANRKIMPGFYDPIESIHISYQEDSTAIDSGSEKNKLLELVRAVNKIDPDIIYFDQGDEFTTHYLTERADANGIPNEFILSRDKVPWRKVSNRGKSYFAYGRILYTPTSQQLFGRINLDHASNNGFEGVGLNGMFEIVRICRMPLHNGSRASIGKCLSSMQFYHAYKDGLLIPWKPMMAEYFKNGNELLVGDRGGFIFEPKVGVHENVGEIDFSSLYPTIMLNHNISAGTVLCECCPQSKDRVPELNYNICEQRQGIVPKSLELVLKKKAHYKRLRNEATSPELKKVYSSRVEALKGILVCCFGYLSYRNAKFGRIDSHMAVCAFARKILLDTVRIAERRGFEVVHGIVDSLWLKKGATEKEFLELCDEIRNELGFPLSFEGIYRWIAFLPSRMHDDVPVLNRYFGVFEDGSLKVRGIEVRRHDTIKLVADCEQDILKLLSGCRDLKEVRERIPEALQILRSYIDRVRSKTVPLEDLVIVNRLSRNYDQYASNAPQAVAARQLALEGLGLMAGQSVSYFITDHKAKNPNLRARNIELLGEGKEYDVQKYLELLVRGASTILRPFGYGEKALEKEVPIARLSRCSS